MTVQEGFILDKSRLDRAVAGFIGDDLPELIERALKAGALEIVADIRRTWPVDTGRSAKAWTAAAMDARVQDGQEIVVVNPVDYAQHVEYGTVHIQPGQHLQRALRTARHQLPASIARAVRRRWNG